MSGIRARERILISMTMGHTGCLSHLTHQTTRIGSFDGIVGSIAVVHRSLLPRNRPFVAIAKERTGNGSTAHIGLAGAQADIFHAQIVDRARHQSEDALNHTVVGNRTFADEVTATIIVALKDAGMTDRRPFASSGAGQYILNEDVTLLLKIDIMGVATVVHIVSQCQQSGLFDDERLVF